MRPEHCGKMNGLAAGAQFQPVVEETIEISR
jgi:hypothetical protein